MPLTYIHTTDDGWKLYRNSDGFIEGFKSTPVDVVNQSKQYKNNKRLVTNQTTIEGFVKYVNGLKPKRRVKDIELKPSQLPKLFPDDQTND